MALVSLPKLADAGYTMVLLKDGATIYDDNTTAITVSNRPILESNWCQHTKIWRLNLNPKNPNTHSPDNQHVNPKTINVIFDLPSLWYHASGGFPPKETFINTVRNRNYATWPKLMVMPINRYYPNFNETVKVHLKGQCQGIQSTKQKALEKSIDNKTVRIKIKGKKITFPPHPTHRNPQSFFHIEDISNLIHTDQTGAFPFISQQGHRYIMVAIHLNVNYIFVKPMCSRSKKEMIRSYKKIINWMRLAGLGPKKHTLDNKASEVFKQCIREQ